MGGVVVVTQESHLRFCLSAIVLLLGGLMAWRILYADSIVSKQVLDRIKQKCIEAYTEEMRNDLQGQKIVRFKTEKGEFEPSRLESVLECFDTFLNPGMKFLDLGSGDGRVVFLASLFGVEATGIEYDPILHQISVNAMSSLSGTIDTGMVRLIKGDYFQLIFSDYDVFYCFEGTNDVKRLEKKLSEEMKPDSILIIYEDKLSVEKTNLIKEFSTGEDVYVYQKGH